MQVLRRLAETIRMPRYVNVHDDMPSEANPVSYLLLTQLKYFLSHDNVNHIRTLLTYYIETGINWREVRLLVPTCTNDLLPYV